MALIIGLLALTAGAAPSVAAAGSTSAGQQLTGMLLRGERSCASLSDGDLEQVGRYAMSQMTGGGSVAAMESRMTQALGTASANRMERLLGAQAVGCTGANRTRVDPAGGWMMEPGNGTGSMMDRASGWQWMQNGAWQHMSRSDWQDRASTMMSGRAPGDGWARLAFLAIIALALVGLAYGARRLLLARRNGGPRQPLAGSGPAGSVSS